MAPLDDKYIQRQWKNIGIAGSLNALHGFVKARKVKDLQKAEKALSEIDAFTLHRPVRKKFQRRSVILHGPRYLFCADLADFQSMSRSNSGFKYILVVQDCFTKELFAAPLKNKSEGVVLAGFKDIMKKAKTPPAKLISDQGLEFTSKRMKAFYASLGIEHYTSFTQQKSIWCERSIKVIKERLYRYMTLKNTKRWVDALAQVVQAYNHTTHSVTKFRPIDVNQSNKDQVFANLHHRIIVKYMKRPEAKFKVGDYVRIAKNRLAFHKGYKAGFSKEVFRVKQVVNSVPVYSYILSDLSGEQLQSSFLAPELGLSAPPEQQNG